MSIVRGNKKLGKAVWHFSLPAREKICTTASSLCSKDCYAKKGHFFHANVQASLEANYQMSLQPGFVSYVVDTIQKEMIALMRMHASGEFYEPPYVRKWVNITRRAPRTEFYAYTRAWRDIEFYAPLSALAARPNMRLWLSSDAETGPPPEMPHTRRCYMQIDDNDIPDFPVDLIFRVKPKTVAKRVAGVMVCPVENGTKAKTTCQACRLCFRNQHHLDRINDYQRNDSLVIVA